MNTNKGPVNRRILTLTCLWLIVTAGFFIFRSSTILLVWSDTSSVSVNLYGDNPPRLWGSPNVFDSLFSRVFGQTHLGGYRPLDALVGTIGVAYFSNPAMSPYIWFAGVGMIYGTLAVCLFLVSRRFVRNDLSALLAVFLFFLSPPIVGMAWLVFTGITPLVLLPICIGLLLYWRITEASKSRIWYLLALCVVLYVGPLYREFAGGLTILIIFLEAQRTHRLTFLTGVAALFLVHAVFPMAVFKLLLFPNLPLKPVFSMGNLGTQINGSAMSGGSLFFNFIQSMRWKALFTLITLVPPTFLLLTPMYFLSIWHGHKGGESEKSDTYGGVNKYLFLLFWFLLFFLPFLRVFTLHAHLAYPLMPFSIIMAVAVENTWLTVWRQRGRRRILGGALGLVMAIGIGDHMLQVYGSQRTVYAINDGILSTAQWFKTHVPRGSIVISNALHVEDIRLFSGNHILPYWTVGVGTADYRRELETPQKLARLLFESHGKRNAYFLDVDFKYSPDKVYYHSHKYVRSESVAMKKIGLVHVTQIKYPFLDPFRMLTPRSFVPFLGGGDLENDFYRGSAQDGTPFMWEIYAEYHVYQVTGTEVAPWDPNIPWRFVEAGFKGFNIFQYGDRFLALAERLGPVDLHWLNTRIVNYFQAQGGFVIGDSLNELKHLLSQFPQAQPSDDAPSSILVEEGYKGFNLLGYGEKIYAIPQGEGAFEIDRIKKNNYSRWFSGGSLDEIKRRLDQVSIEQRKENIPVPVLIEAGYRGFNLVRYGQKIYAIPQGEGAFEIERIGNNGYSRWFSGSSSGEVRRLIDQPLKK
jgi:hypothetical protein